MLGVLGKSNIKLLRDVFIAVVCQIIFLVFFNSFKQCKLLLYKWI